MPNWFTPALVAAVYLILRTTGPRRLPLIRLIGVTYHELGHWLLALLTRSRPSPVKIPWKVDPEGHISYGEVTFVPGTWTAAMVALSPLIFTPWAVWWALSLDPLSALIAAPILAHGFPSATDWKVALAHPASWPAASAAIFVSNYFWISTWVT